MPTEEMLLASTRGRFLLSGSKPCRLLCTIRTAESTISSTRTTTSSSMAASLPPSARSRESSPRPTSAIARNLRVEVRDLKEEALRVYRSRVVNPKWIENIKRHGYKGGLELAAAVYYLFGFDATAQIAPDFVYNGLAEHYALSQEMRDFLAKSNPWALNAIAERLLEAANRELWENPNPETLEALRGVLLESETILEAQGERRREAAGNPRAQYRSLFGPASGDFSVRGHKLYLPYITSSEDRWSTPTWFLKSKPELPDHLWRP